MKYIAAFLLLLAEPRLPFYAASVAGVDFPSGIAAGDHHHGVTQ